MKIPTVEEKHVIVIDGKEHVVSSTSWTESVSEVIESGDCDNNPSAILRYVKFCNED